jgi:hypothetical protein
MNRLADSLLIISFLILMLKSSDRSVVGSIPSSDPAPLVVAQPRDSGGVRHSFSDRVLDA